MLTNYNMLMLIVTLVSILLLMLFIVFTQVYNGCCQENIMKLKTRTMHAQSL